MVNGAPHLLTRSRGFATKAGRHEDLRIPYRQDAKTPRPTILYHEGTRIAYSMWFGYQLSAISYQLSTIDYRLSAISYGLSTIGVTHAPAHLLAPKTVVHAGG